MTEKRDCAGDISTCPKVQIIRLADLAPGLNKTILNHQKRKVSNLKSRAHPQLHNSSSVPQVSISLKGTNTNPKRIDIYGIDKISETANKPLQAPF